MKLRDGDELGSLMDKPVVVASVFCFASDNHQPLGGKLRPTLLHRSSRCGGLCGRKREFGASDTRDSKDPVYRQQKEGI